MSAWPPSDHEGLVPSSSPSPADQVPLESPHIPSFVGQRVGRFHISRKIGSGGASTVYQAYDAVDARSVALKVMLPGSDQVARQRFRQETRIASRLQHPHIVETYQVGDFREHNVGYIAMELVYGDTLEDLLRKVSQLNFVEACCLLAPIAQALTYAHSENLVHRDVKPSNILMRPSTLHDENHIRIASVDHPFVPLLTDFGIAWTGDDPDLTSTGRTVGSPAYMSPEQCSGDVPVDGRTDIYALGSVLYRCVVGKNLFTGSTAEILFKQVNLPFDENNRDLQQVTLPPDLLALLRQCLAKHPEDRIQSSAELASLLAEIGSSTEIGPLGLNEHLPDDETQTMPHLDTSPQWPPTQPSGAPAESQPRGHVSRQWVPLVGAAILVMTIAVILVRATEFSQWGQQTLLGAFQSFQSTPTVPAADVEATPSDPMNSAVTPRPTPELPEISAVPFLPEGTPTVVPYIIVNSEEGINVRSGPGVEYPILMTRNHGSRLDITGIDHTNTWWEVNVSDFLNQAGSRGWVYSSLAIAHNAQRVMPVAQVSPVPEPTATATPVPTSTPSPSPTPTATPTATATPLSYRDLCLSYSLYEDFRDLYENFDALSEFGCQTSIPQRGPVYIQDFRWGFLLYRTNSNRIYAGTRESLTPEGRGQRQVPVIAFRRFPSWDSIFVSPADLQPGEGEPMDPEDFFEPFLQVMEERTADRKISLRLRLGDPVGASRAITGVVQHFDLGTMILVEEEDRDPYILQLGKLERADYQ